ncbi:WXG100 family type VII secretion target [Glycomyces sp. NPDC046736]|uniref:WXG100 family type VII secretion target n=1 Tax=Glycomyces sp. NPDC046736 TaxID=3155615 RepID=UPI0033C993B6
MSFGVQVESSAIRSGAGKMGGFAGEAKQLTPEMEREASAADQANRGFMTGEACEAVADDFKQDMRELQEHLEDTQQALEEIAQDWDDNDQGVSEEFDRIGSDLSNLRMPGL